MDTTDIFVYDHTFTPLGVIDHYESLIWADRYYESGDFEMYLRMSQVSIPLARIGNYLMRHDTEHVMVVESYEISCDYEDGDMLILKGRSLEGLLSRRIIIDAFAFEGEFQTLIHRLLNENIISPINKDRRIANFKFVEPTDTRLMHYTVTSDTAKDANKVYYTKGYSQGKTIYVGFTGTEFETGVTYYEKVITKFIITSDRSYQPDKTYYTMSEVDGEVAYNEFRGKEFSPDEVYYEPVIEYLPTADEEYSYEKRYYLKTKEDKYPEYTVFEGDSFEAGVAYYELTKKLIKREYKGGENLYEVISDICQEQDVGFRVLLDDKNNFIFSLYMGLDHSRDQYENEYVIFSPEFNNVVSSRFKEDTTTYKNVVYALTTNEDESDMEFGAGSGLIRREMALDKSQFAVGAMDESTIDSIVDDEEVPEDDTDHENEITIDIEIGTPAQYKEYRTWNDSKGRIIAGCSHTGLRPDGSSDPGNPGRRYNMQLKFPFRSDKPFKDLTFNLYYAKAMNADRFVADQIYEYGLGTDSNIGRNMTEFTWDTSGRQCLNCKIEGEFQANTDYYLWIDYSKYLTQHVSYVQGVSVENAQATSWEETESVSVKYTKESTEQRAREELKNAGKTYTFDTEIDRVYTFAFRDNFELGDIVQIEDPYNHSAHARVTEVIESFDENGPAHRPTFTVLEDTITDNDEIGMYDDPIDI